MVFLLNVIVSAGVSYGVFRALIDQERESFDPVSRRGWDHDEFARGLIGNITIRLNDDIAPRLESVESAVGVIEADILMLKIKSR